MYESLKTTLTAWNNRATDRDKLQHTYITVALGLLIAAGVIGLLNHDLGQQILAISIACAGVFLVNAVAWALLQSFILIRIEGKAPAVKQADTLQKPSRKK